MDYPVEQISEGGEEREEHSGQIQPGPQPARILFTNRTHGIGSGWQCAHLDRQTPRPHCCLGSCFPYAGAIPLVASFPLFSLERWEAEGGTGLLQTLKLQ